MYSGPPIEHLRKGWAKFPFVGRRVHYWIEDTDTMLPTIAEGGRARYYTAACRVLGVTTPLVPALHPGDWTRCKRCEKKKAA